VNRGVHVFSTTLERRFERHQGAQAVCLKEIALDMDGPGINLAARVE